MNERTNDANPVRILCGIAVVVAVEIILGVLLLITVVRLGRAPVDWGLGSAVGAVVLLAAALAASYAILAVASSDQPQASPGLPTVHDECESRKWSDWARLLLPGRRTC